VRVAASISGSSRRLSSRVTAPGFFVGFAFNDGLS
jgi:hypothetical protein